MFFPARFGVIDRPNKVVVLSYETEEDARWAIALMGMTLTASIISPLGAYGNLRTSLGNDYKFLTPDDALEFAINKEKQDA